MFELWSIFINQDIPLGALGYKIANCAYEKEQKIPFRFKQNDAAIRKQ